MIGRRGSLRRMADTGARCDTRHADPGEPDMAHRRAAHQALLVLLLLPLGACSAADGQDAAAPLPPEVTGRTWQLVRIASMDDQVYLPSRPETFTLRFDPSGQVAVSADCNRGSATWTFTPPSSLQFGPIATTRMACPPGSLHDRFLSNLGYVRSFVMRDGGLYLATLADGAILEFVPATGLPGDAGSPAMTDDGGPSFDCGAVTEGSIEALVCGDAQLSALDRQLAGVFAAASGAAAAQQPPVLKAEQRGWIKGRDDCWKAADSSACVTDSYQRRIAELQAQYRLVDHNGPVSYGCDGNRANEVVVTWFETEPPTLIAERGDQASLMYLERGASGARYAGRNESFWEHQGEATVQWGFGAPQMRCVPLGAADGR